jgi:crotonobetainyl-CoA:carnitine CoA-transferase CaiB-like acyl-CoA transferase
MNDPLKRGRRGADIIRHLQAWAKLQFVDDAVARGQALGVPIAKYQSSADIFASEQSLARGMFSTVDLPGVGPAQMPTAPIQFPQQPLPVRRAAAAPGAETKNIH